MMCICDTHLLATPNPTCVLTQRGPAGRGRDSQSIGYILPEDDHMIKNSQSNTHSRHT